MIDEATTRKARSIDVLKSRNIPWLENLPPIDTANEVEIRSGDIVIQRAMCLFAVSRAAIHNDADAASSLISRWGLSEAMTPKEVDFLHSDSPSQKTLVQFSWRCEAMIPLMWATGLIHEMPFPDEQYDFAQLEEFWLVQPRGYWEKAGTRDAHVILDQADLIYRYHWAVRQAHLDGAQSPGALDAGVVLERHHALNWLVGYAGLPWDDVPTDT